MKHLLIIDGSNLLFQMFYGMPSGILSKSGKPIHAVFGFIGALRKILAQVDPDYIFIPFDGEIHNKRIDLNPLYKANREDYSSLPDEELPFSQLPEIYDALDLLKIKHAETTDCEADDWIAAYALRYGTKAAVTIVSMDSDFFQLINQNVNVLRYRGRNSILCGEAYLEDRFGIRPSQYADFKSMTGDPADNICGARHIGPKTAAWLLHTYQDLDGILGHIDQISKPSIRRSLDEASAFLPVNRQLILLDGSAQCPFDLEDLTYHPSPLSTRRILAELDFI